MTWVLLVPGVLILSCLITVLRRWFLKRQIQRLEATLEELRRELAVLEALTTEDRAWFDKMSGHERVARAAESMGDGLGPTPRQGDRPDH